MPTQEQQNPHYSYDPDLKRFWLHGFGREQIQYGGERRLIIRIDDAELARYRREQLHFPRIGSDATCRIGNTVLTCTRFDIRERLEVRELEIAIFYRAWDEEVVFDNHAGVVAINANRIHSWSMNAHVGGHIEYTITIACENPSYFVGDYREAPNAHRILEVGGHRCLLNGGVNFRNGIAEVSFLSSESINFPNANGNYSEAYLTEEVVDEHGQVRAIRVPEHMPNTRDELLTLSRAAAMAGVSVDGVAEALRSYNQIHQDAQREAGMFMPPNDQNVLGLITGNEAAFTDPALGNAWKAKKPAAKSSYKEQQAKVLKEGKLPARRICVD